MSVNTAIARGRAAAEAIMQETFAIYQPTGFAVDPVDGMEKFEYAFVGTTSGRMSTRSRGFNTAESRFVKVGALRRPVLIGALHLPWDSLRPEPGEFGMGWEYEITAIGPSTDPDLLGRRYLIVEASSRSFTTARRLDVVEILFN